MKKPFLKFMQAASFLLVAATSLQAQFPHSPVDPAVRERGATLYAGSCASCHGEDARGTVKGPDLIRSLAVLHDRREMLYGKELGPLLTTLPGHSFKYDDKQLAGLSQFLTASINGILRSGYNAQPTNLLSGDPKAGEAFFNGTGGCNKCHSPTGDFAGIGKKYSPATLQQKFLFPNNGIFTKKKTQVTVKLRDGKTYAGDLVRIDDFTVTFREKSGKTYSFNLVPGITVTTEDPFAAHAEVLDKFTDADMHNMTTYLDTLK